MRNKKLPYVIRYTIYSLNCIFNLLFPIGIVEDEFTRGFKNRHK